MKPLTIITVCYNDPKLHQTCESIVHQSNQDFEWIVIDGGSNEQTQRIWNKYKYRIDTFVSEKDTGIYNAMNKGIKLAHGKFINFMNAGDQFEDLNTLKHIIPILKENQNNVIYGDCRFIKKGSGKIKHQNCPDIFFWLYDNINHQSAFIARSLFKKYGLYDESYKIIADWDKFTLFYLNNIPFKHIPLCISRFYRDGISSRKDLKSLLYRERSIMEKRHFSEQDLNIGRKIIQNRLPDLHGLEKIFSIKNSHGRIFKIITICGFQFRFRRKSK